MNRLLTLYIKYIHTAAQKIPGVMKSNARRLGNINLSWTGL